jgi:predicted TIM-barrel fold metal-dependent hydrolase/quinol monooxygenase YgiN
MTKIPILSALAAATAAFAADVTPPPAADVHCHFTTPDYLAALEAHGAAMDELYPVPAWSPEALASFLDEAGIGFAVLTSVAPHPHFGDAAESAVLCRSINDQAARLAAADPERLAWCATLPLPSVKEAVAEAVRALDELGATGVKLPTNARGLYLGDPALDPLMATLDERGAVAVLHPHRPEPFDAKLADGLPLAMYEYPAETTRALARLFARNVPARYPRVKFVVPHAGAFLPLALPRMKAVHPVVRAKGLSADIDWDANLRSLWFDLAGSPTADAVRRLLALTTPDRILYGSDFPYVPASALAAGLAKLRAELAANPDLAPLAEDILSGNARNLFHKEDAGHEACTKSEKECPTMTNAIFRIAEIEVKPEFLEEYLAAAATVGATSVREEPGVLCIYPMQDAERPTSIRILEIYRDETAYQSHLATPHFLSYKTGTPHMIESLRLAPMRSLDPSLAPDVFRKIANQTTTEQRNPAP